MVKFGVPAGEWGDHIVTWREGGKLSEEKSVHESTKADAKDSLKAQYRQALKQGHQVSLNAAARALFSGKPSRDDVWVDIWEERDRLHIGVAYKDDHPLYPGKSIADWWDDDARQMFEDGFFERRPRLEDSVLKYCEEVGL